VSQHITGITFGSWTGVYLQTIRPSCARSSAMTLFGNGVCTYIMFPMTSGAPSWPRSTPVEKVQATSRSPTFSLVIWSSGE
jgi:hypothetical protein